MSDPIDLPPNLTTSVERERVQVPIDIMSEREYKPEEIQRICESGGIILDPKRLRALHDLGFAAEQIGILRMLKGGVVVSLNGVSKVLEAAASIADGDPATHSVKERLEAAKIVGYLAGQMIKVASGTVKIDQTVVETVMNQDKKTRQSFPPGTAVRLNG